MTIDAARPTTISDDEWVITVNLTAAFRLVTHYGSDDLILPIFLHVSLSLNPYTIF
ncbi:MAG: hypothetical protein ACP5QR_06065 [Rhizomicrobium sp.]